MDINLKDVLESHRKWLLGQKGGRRADLSGADLRNADLSGADLSDAVLSGADLRNADLSGADLSNADLSDAVLSGADLRNADLSGADLRNADLRNAVLSGADLRDADLSGADLSDAVLSGADLRNADLRNADLSGAEIPIVEQLHAKMLAAIESPGNSLNMNDWHSCETTHCRAGWAVHLAGEAGYKLEEKVGPAMAGALISVKSCPHLEKVPNFYESNDAALADIRRLAAIETAQQ